MKFLVYLAASLTLGLSVACLTPDPAPASATVPGKSGVDSGTATVVNSGPTTLSVISSNNLLPPAWDVTDITILEENGGGSDAGLILNMRVMLNDSSNTPVSSSGDCILPISGGGCQGFWVRDPSSLYSVFIDTTEYISTANCTYQTDGEYFPTVTGIWYDQPSSVGADVYVLAPTTCEDMTYPNQGAGMSTAGAPPTSNSSTRISRPALGSSPSRAWWWPSTLAAEASSRWSWKTPRAGSTRVSPCRRLERRRR